MPKSQAKSPVTPWKNDITDMGFAKFSNICGVKPEEKEGIMTANMVIECTTTAESMVIP
jgi:hypothetical protein